MNKNYLSSRLAIFTLMILFGSVYDMSGGAALSKFFSTTEEEGLGKVLSKIEGKLDSKLLDKLKNASEGEISLTETEIVSIETAAKEVGVTIKKIDAGIMQDATKVISTTISTGINKLEALSVKPIARNLNGTTATIAGHEGISMLSRPLDTVARTSETYAENVVERVASEGASRNLVETAVQVTPVGLISRVKSVLSNLGAKPFASISKDYGVAVKNLKDVKKTVKAQESTYADLQAGTALEKADGSVISSSGQMDFEVTGKIPKGGTVKNAVANGDKVEVTFKNGDTITLTPKTGGAKAISDKSISAQEIAESAAQRINKSKGEVLTATKGGASIGKGDLTLAKFDKTELTSDALKSNEILVNKAQVQADKAATLGVKVTRGVIKAPVYVLKKVKSIVSGGGMMLLNAIGFSLPNTLFQMQQEKNQKKALLATVSNVQPFGDLFLQIPPTMLFLEDPSQSKFVYLEVPSGIKQPLIYFTPDVLNNGNYYVVFAGDYTPWASTYLGSASFTGEMINLNTGWCFAGKVSVDDTKPTFPLRPKQTTSSQNQTVESYLNTLIGGYGQTQVVHATTINDWFAGAGGSSNNASTNTVDPIIKALFSTGDQEKVSLAGLSGFVTPPPVFSKAISAFRQKRVLPNFGNIALTEFQGTGYLNHLLSPGIKWDDPANEPIFTAVQKLVTKQTTYTQLLSSKSPAAADLQKAIQDILSAEEALSQLVVHFPGDAGLNVEEDLNMYGIYIYELGTDDADVKTPSLDFLLKSSKHSSIPIKEYVVCLDASGVNIIPLIVPAIVKKGNGSSTVDYKLNPLITYIASLTTGMTYLSNGTGALGAPLMMVDNVTPDTQKATGALNTIMQQISTAAKGTPTITAVLAQIVDMSNYAVNAAVKGPFILTNGYQFEEVPLNDVLTAETTALDINVDNTNKNESDLFSGVTANSGSAFANVGTPEQISFLQKTHVYKVSIPGCNSSPTIGALSYTNAQGVVVDIPDYVIATTPTSDNKSQTILPLGLNSVTGAPMPTNTLYLISLITGRMYDTNYNPLPPSLTTQIIDRSYISNISVNGDVQSIINTFNSTKNWPTTQKWVTDPATGKQVLANVPYFVDQDGTPAAMATGYMPTAFNPNNMIFVNPADRATYKSNLAALVSAKDAQALAAQKVNQAFGANATAPIPSALLDIYNTSIASASDFVAALQKQYSVSSSIAQSLKTALDGYQQATNVYTMALTKYNTFQAKVDSGGDPKPPYTGKTVAAGLNNQLQIPPLYFVFFSRYSVTSDGGVTEQSIPAGAGLTNAAITWIDTQASTQSIQIAITNPDNSQTLIPLANILPKTFVGFDIKNSDTSTIGTCYASCAGNKNFSSLLSTYNAWSLSQSSKYWSENIQMGPLNFTTAAIAASDKAANNQNNVYLSATSRADVANQNYFYRATGFDQSDIFVLGHTADATTAVQSLNDLQEVGGAFFYPGGAQWYMINISTGYVYTPYGTPPAAGSSGGRCVYTQDAMGNPVNVCVPGAPSTSKWWTLQQAGKTITLGGKTTIIPLKFNPADVIAKVLQNTVVKGHAATMADLTPSLQKLLVNVQAVGQQVAAQNLYPFYFNNQFTLRLRQDQLDNGSYVYGVVNKAESYLGASDYLVTCSVVIDKSGYANVYPLPAPLTATTPSMLSLVSGTVYTSSTAVAAGGTSITEAYVANGFDISETPGQIIKSIPQLASDLMTSISSLNSLYAANKEQTKVATTSLIPPLDITTLAPVTTDAASPYANLYMSSASGKTKYFVKSQTPGFIGIKASDGTITPTATMVDTYFDFKVTATGLEQDQIADYGASYQINPTTKKVVPGATLIGYPLQIMRSHNGVYVNPDGTQALGIPVVDMYIPKADSEVALVPALGQSGIYMQYLDQFGVMNDVGNNAQYTYYQNNALNGLFAGVQDNGIPVTDPHFTKSATTAPTLIKNPDKFVNLLTGDSYDTTGAPLHRKVTMAFKHLNPRPNIQTLGGVTAAILPLVALQSAAPVTTGKGTVTDNLYKVNGKYYYMSVDYTPVVDMYGNTQNDANGNELIAQTTRYFDFNASRTSVNPASDTGMGIWYQVAVDASNNAKAVPIDDTWIDDPSNVDAQYLTDARVYYGVMVDAKGKQTLVDPVLTGVDYRSSLFVWGDQSAFDESYSVQVMFNDGDSYSSYNYVPFSRVYKFTTADNSALFDYAYVPTATQTTETQSQVQVTTITGNGNQTVAALASTILMGDALQNAITAGYLLYAVEYQVTTGVKTITITETMLTPKTYTTSYDSNEYLEIKPNITYQTAWKTSPADTSDIVSLQAIGNTLVQGTPFVASIIGGRPQNTQEAPSITGGMPVIAGILNSSNGGLLSLVTSGLDSDGAPTTQYFIEPGIVDPTHVPSPGTLVGYNSVTGISINAMTSNYPILNNPISGAPLNQGNYITVQSDSTNEYLYSYIHEVVSDNQLNAMTSQVAIVYNVDGIASLAGAFAAGDVVGISGAQGPMAQNIGFVSAPDQRVLYSVPADSAVKAYYASDKTLYTDDSGNQISAYTNFATSIGIYPAGTYIDYTDGVIFAATAANANQFYPVGNAVSSSELALIHAQFGNAMPVWNQGVPTLVAPDKYAQQMATLTPDSSITAQQAITSGTSQSAQQVPVAKVVAPSAPKTSTIKKLPPKKISG